MTQHLPPRSFRDGYVWRGERRHDLVSNRLPFDPDGRVHPMRARYEFYPTPPEATRALLSVETFHGTVWEPACGRGHISTVLEAAGSKLYQRTSSNEILDWAASTFCASHIPGPSTSSQTHPMAEAWGTRSFGMPSG